MIEFIFNFISVIAGILVIGAGSAVTVAGIKIIATGFGWVF